MKSTSQIFHKCFFEDSNHKYIPDVKELMKYTTGKMLTIAVDF